MLPLPSPDEMQPGFKEAMQKSVRDGLRAAAVEAARRNYLDAWNAQSWLWRKIHWKLKPSRHGVGESLRFQTGL